MGQVTEAEVAAAIGRVDEMILREVVRTQASSGEVRQALALVGTPADLSAGETLPPRMQRLVDLLSVAVPEPVGPRRPQNHRPAQVGGQRRAI
ncbi:hypothetical protein [Bosea sp. (in: a-proteobacteria)]|uniref:hypothetical protein n=1 Tax=Bosea sp. (in: a-proteobacteria) TaxID=1871050 RepID=UPI003B3A25F8